MSDTIVPDSEHRGLVARLPQLPRDLAMLARFDRPIGWWLLFWPCVWGLWLAGAGWQWALLGWFLVGSIAMRGAGCVYNDIVDRDLDAQVARTPAQRSEDMHGLGRELFAMFRHHADSAELGGSAMLAEAASA